MARVGILGGTFNPPHIGHLLCAQEARVGLGLDRVVLVPTGTPPHKTVVADPGAGVRLALCRAAVAGDPGLSVSPVEVDRAGPSWTVDTLRSLHASAPEHELTFIMGGDMAHSFPEWREPSAILELASLGVAERSGVARAEIVERLEPLTPRVSFFGMPRVDISSSLIRERVAAGLPVRYLVPDGVASLIESEGLYRA
ncbi:MAG TPA: nicotinate-nucleotide adenylyltransferase [Solirubrobacteraceae bacterium]